MQNQLKRHAKPAENTCSSLERHAESAENACRVALSILYRAVLGNDDKRLQLKTHVVLENDMPNQRKTS